MAQSRRDQVQAQSYVLGRLTSALVTGDPERSENPHRRTVTGVVVGVLITALVVAGSGLYGYLRPGGSTAWRKPGTLVLEKETGSRYVFTDGQLRPVLNYASARLLFGADPPRVSVSSRSLTGVTRGLPVGVVAAPDALPRADALTGVTWTACPAVGSGLTLALATEASGEPLAERAVVVSPGRGQNFLIWRGHRYQLGAAWMARVFGYDGPVVPVDSRWPELLPPAADINPVEVPGRGEPGPRVQGEQTLIGQLFVVRLDGADDRYYVLLRDGFSPLTATGYAIVAADPQTAKAYPGGAVAPIPVGPPALAEVPVSERRLVPQQAPPVPPAIGVAGDERAWCVRRDAAGITEVVADAPAAGQSPDTDQSQDAAAVIRLAPGSGGLVAPGRTGQTAGTARYLITDAGLRYPVPTTDAAEALGYAPDTATPVPPEWLRLLPEGPALDLSAVRGS
ncbi:type VII secretion protein EccB [Actinoplanes lutulentus]|uniref:Type VII secretion protein EccB n=1 Tax=Actinoplanes lutulentus TaxID=1287878 RepID=A0A327ZIX4_9ACTN|nr:type VII secretion protein EccB [Actinoplanes lutulentus]MBB2940606.1 type VII secretion protein EccB [Actinoplanes lutulentus]RAK42917.1 type VII secretion protein EccB [Actinoplanes lutulentus]